MNDGAWRQGMRALRESSTLPSFHRISKSRYLHHARSSIRQRQGSPPGVHIGCRQGDIYGRDCKSSPVFEPDHQPPRLPCVSGQGACALPQLLVWSGQAAGSVIPEFPKATDRVTFSHTLVRLALVHDSICTLDITSKRVLEAAVPRRRCSEG